MRGGRRGTIRARILDRPPKFSPWIRPRILRGAYCAPRRAGKRCTREMSLQTAVGRQPTRKHHSGKQHTCSSSVTSGPGSRIRATRRERRPRGRTGAGPGPAVYTLARRLQTIRLPARALRTPPPSPPPPPRTRGESEPCCPAGPQPLRPPPLRQARARQASAPRKAGKLGTCAQDFPSRAAVACVTFRATFRDAGSVTHRLRRGSPGPRRLLNQPQPVRASVSASVQWGGPAPGAGDPVAPHRPPARPPGAGPRTRPERGTAAPPPPRPESTDTGKMASGAGPRRDPGRPESPRTCQGPEKGFVVAAGESGTGTARGAGARPPPGTCPRPAQVRPAGAPRGLRKPSGARAPRCRGRGRRLAGDREGPRRRPRAAAASPGTLGGGCSGLGTPSLRAPGLLGAKPLCKTVSRFCKFRWKEPPRGRGVVAVLPQHLLWPRAGSGLQAALQLARKGGLSALSFPRMGRRRADGGARCWPASKDRGPHCTHGEFIPGGCQAEKPRAFFWKPSQNSTRPLSAVLS